MMMAGKIVSSALLLRTEPKRFVINNAYEPESDNLTSGRMSDALVVAERFVPLNFHW